MCGIVGLISKRQSGFHSADQDMFRRLLLIDGEFRGLDSTGLFQVQVNRQSFVVKSATIPALFFESSQWKSAMSRMFSGSRVVIGHNRKSTMGATNSQNAHPFHEENIILVHNGTLQNHGKLAKDVDVDSHAVCKAFAAGKAEEVLPTINGAFAFVWWDMQKDRLFAIRNSERPLSFVETDDNLYIASEPWMVYALLQRNNVPKDKIKIIDLQPGELYEVDVFGGKAEMKTTTIELAKEVQRAPFTRTGQTTRTHGALLRQGDGSTVLVGSTVGQTKGIETPDNGCNDCEGGDVDLDITGEERRENVVQLFPNYEKKLPRGTTVMVKFYKANPQGVPTVRAYRFFGNIVTPGLPTLDAQGTVLGLYEHELEPYFTSPMIAEVDYISETASGPIVHLRRIERDITVKTFGGDVGWKEWEYISDSCKCSKCSAEIKLEDSTITLVKRLSIGEKSRYHIECSDCLDKATQGDKNGKQQSRNTPVSNGKPQRKLVEPSSVIRLPHPPSAANT